MKKRKILPVLIVILLLAVLIVVVLRFTGKKENQSSLPAEGFVTETPAPTVDSEGMDIPEGVYLVEPPADAKFPETETPTSGYSGITIVDVPDASAGGGNSGVYIVETPKPNGGPNGVYIVETPNPTGAPRPTGAPSPIGKTLASGSATSSSGTGLNMTMEYSAVTSGDSTVTVKLSCYLNHSALTAKANTLSFSCNGQYGSASTPSISHTGGATSTYLGSKSFTVNLSSGQSATISLGASLPFGGNYSGVYISSLECSKSVSISR